MYLDFFKLQKMPFRLAPDSAFLYWSTGHTAAVARTRSPLAHQNGGVAVLGNKGVGKSTLLEYLERECGAHPPLRLSLPPPSLQALNEILAPVEQCPPGKEPLVLCDNAHLFAPALLCVLLKKTLRPHIHPPALRIVLAGEPKLGEVLADPAVSRMSSPLGEPFHLSPLTSEGVIGYVRHRLAIAGAHNAQIFSDDICVEIHRETGGNPRLVNALCDAAMALASERELSRVGITEIRRGLEDIAALSRAHETETFSLENTSMNEASALLADPPKEEARSAEGALGHVRVVHEGRVLFERDLTRGILRVGRGEDNDLRIEGRYISRNHCRIVTNGSMSLLEDVRSTNGLFVNARRVRNHRLRDGDVIQLGDHELRYADYRVAKGDGG